jgi:hypothetical protein
MKPLHEVPFDEGRAKIYFMNVIRLLLAVFIAIGLALGPAAPTIAMSSAAAMPGCNMGDKMPEHPADHSKMNCCTAACQAPASAALLPQRSAADERIATHRSAHSLSPVKELASAASTGTDPPPRLQLS